MFGVMVLLKLTYNTQTNAKENYLTMEQIVVKTNIYHHENLLYELNCKERRMLFLLSKFNIKFGDNPSLIVTWVSQLTRYLTN